MNYFFSLNEKKKPKFNKNLQINVSVVLFNQLIVNQIEDSDKIYNLK